MNAKSELISKLKKNKRTRQAYIRAKINVNLPSQIRALRLRRDMKQEDLAREAEMLQPRISAMERPGATKFNLETLIRLAAAFRVGLLIKFVPFSEMLKWENGFSQDTFKVTPIDDDTEFQKDETVESNPTSPLPSDIILKWIAEIHDAQNAFRDALQKVLESSGEVRPLKSREMISEVFAKLQMRTIESQVFITPSPTEETKYVSGWPLLNQPSGVISQQINTGTGGI